MLYRDDEVHPDEEHELPGLHHGLLVHVARRLEDDERRVAENLQLGPLMPEDRVLDGQRVQSVPTTYCLQGGGVRLSQVEPDELSRRRPGEGERRVDRVGFHVPHARGVARTVRDRPGQSTLVVQ